MDAWTVLLSLLLTLLPMMPAPIERQLHRTSPMLHAYPLEGASVQPLVPLLRYALADCDTALPAFYAGNCALLRDDFAAARTAFERAINAGDHVRAGRVNLAWTRYQQGASDAALAWLDELVREAQTRPGELAWALAQRAQLHALRFDYDAALADMDAALALPPGETTLISREALYTLRGQMVMLIYEWERAREDYNRALTLNPRYAPALFHRGVLAYTMAQRDAARRDFQRYLAVAPAGVYARQAYANMQRITIELEALN